MPSYRIYQRNRVADPHPFNRDRVRIFDLYLQPKQRTCTKCEITKRLTEFAIDKNWRITRRCSDCAGDKRAGRLAITAEMLVPPDDVKVPKGLLPVLSAVPVPEGARLGDTFKCHKFSCKQTYQACLRRIGVKCECPQGEEIAKHFMGC